MSFKETTPGLNTVLVEAYRKFNPAYRRFESQDMPAFAAVENERDPDRQPLETPTPTKQTPYKKVKTGLNRLLRRGSEEEDFERRMEAMRKQEAKAFQLSQGYLNKVRKTPGTYPLGVYGVHHRYYWARGNNRVFNYNTHFTVDGDNTCLDFDSSAISARLGDGAVPMVEIQKGKAPLLHLPEGHKIEVTTPIHNALYGVPNPEVGYQTDYYGLYWVPGLTSEPRLLIPDPKHAHEAIFKKFSPDPIVPVTIFSAPEDVLLDPRGTAFYQRYPYTAEVPNIAVRWSLKVNNLIGQRRPTIVEELSR